MVDILILGATGFTGRLTARYLHQHPQRLQTASSNSTTHRPFTFAVSGRSPSKLNELVVSLGLGDDVEVIVVDTNNDEDVERAVKRANVVINCVGPFWKYSFGVVKACAENGVHYVDITGETHFVFEIIKRYDYLAYKHSSIIIPSCGFDSLPSDIIAYVAASAVRKALAPPPSPGSSNVILEAPSALIASSATSIKLWSAGASGGTLSTVFSALEEVPKEALRKTRGLDCLSPVKKPKEKAPSNNPSLVYSLAPAGAPRSLFNSLSATTTSTGRKSPFTRWGSFFFLAAHNRAIVMRSWGLLERENAGWMHDTTVHHLENENGPIINGKPLLKDVVVKTYGLDFVYNEFSHAKGPIQAMVTSLIWLGLAVGLVLISPVRWLVKKIIPQPGEGPSEEEMKKAHLLSTNVTTSIPIQTDIQKKAKPCIVKTTMEIKCDPGYLGTAIMSSEAALSLLHVPSLPPLAQHGGILTPATALGDVIVQRLSDVGYWEIGSTVVQHPDN